MKKKCAFYIRATGNLETSILQHREMETYAKARNFEIAHVYEDAGIGPLSKRERLAELFRDVRLHRFKVVLVWRLDKMFISSKHARTVIEEFEELGVGFVSVRDEIDTASLDGRLFKQLLFVFASLDARIWSERALNGQKGHKKRTCFFGRPSRVDKAEVIKLFRSGIKQREIAKRFSCNESYICKVLQESQVEQPKDNRKVIYI